MAYQVTVSDASTHSPISGASVFVYFQDGTPFLNLSSANDGIVQINTTSVIISLQVTAPGYQLYKNSLIVGTVELQPDTAAVAGLVITVEPTTDQTNPDNQAPTKGATAAISNSQGVAIESVTIGDDGGATCAEDYVPGQYSISISAANFETLQATFTVAAGDTSKTFTLVQTDPGSSVEAQAAATPSNSPAVQTPSVLTSDDIDPYEFIYPNSVDGKYFQAAQARMYIGSLFVDELAFCQFQLMMNRIPVYGYRSQKFDAMGTGRSLVQGQLGVNFVSEGYMYVLLQEFNRQIASKLSTTCPVDAATAAEVNQLVKARAAAPDTSAINDRLKQIACISKPAGDYVKSALNNNRKQLTGYNTIQYQNACYLDIPFTIDVELEGADRTVKRTLLKCFLGGNDFSFSHDGKTLLDTYSFIARDLA
jgi:hypothetical protein